MPPARATALRLRVAGRLTMRTLFVLCLVVVGVGLAYFLALGFLHR